MRVFDEPHEIIQGDASEKVTPILELAKQLNGESKPFTDAPNFNAKVDQEIAHRGIEVMAGYLRQARRDHVRR